MAEPEALRDSEKKKPPPDVEERMKRGRSMMREGAAERNECWSFWRKKHYVHSRGRQLITQPTTTNIVEQTGKLPWRVRAVRNFIFDIVEREVAKAVSRVPGYEVTASTTDPKDQSAARLAEKVARYGYDKWKLRKATESVVRYAIIADGGYAWPYFDNTIGPFIADGDGRVGMGDIRVRIYGGNEVGWEPGVPFMDSPWHIIEQAQTPESVKAMEGFLGGKLEADAESGNEAGKQMTRGAKLVLVTEYLERPCAEYPEGRWITFANGRVIVPERPYPCTDSEDEPIDEPVLHELTYALDPDADRDQGLVTHLLDSQRAKNLAESKESEWIKLSQNPQLVIQNGALAEGQRLTDEPGAVYNVFGSGKVEWRPVPPVPDSLARNAERAVADMDRIAAQGPMDASQIESGKEAQVYAQSSSERRGTFTGNLSEFHSRLMRHNLYLVAKHYTDERLLKVGGRFPQILPDFRGSQLRSQVDVTVRPETIEPRDKQFVEQRVMNYAQLGWISPEAAMAAINSGQGEALIESYEMDIARAQMVIQKIQDGTLMNDPPRAVFPNEDAGPKLDQNGQPIPVLDANGAPVLEPGPPDPMTGMPGPPQIKYQQATEVPSWLPRPGVDNIRVHKQQFEDFMKTTDYDMLPEPGKEQTHLVYSALIDLEMREAQRAAELQSAQAQQMGELNAAKPPAQSPLPSLPGMNGQQRQLNTT